MNDSLYLPRCGVCGARTVADTSYMEHVLMEEHSTCSCGLWDYDYVTGCTEERIGYVRFNWSYAESADEWATRRDGMKVAKAEAERMNDDRRALPFRRAIRDNPDDDTARLVFADWLGENGYPLNEQAIRTEVTRS